MPLYQRNSLMIYRVISIFTCCLLPYLLEAQLPETDIYLLNLAIANNKLSLTDPQNITPQKGYQNQPCFSRDGQLILYTSQCDTCSSTSIYAYALLSKERKQLIVTSMSPYSAMPAATENAITAVTVEPDSSQRIWQYSLTDNQAMPLFSSRDSVGYYTWLNDHAVLAYILGSGANNSRLSMLKDDGNEKILATNIGRSMRPLAKGAVFIQQVDTTNYLAWTDLSATKTLIKTPGNSQDLAIVGDRILMASNSILYAATLHMDHGIFQSIEAFVPVQDLSVFGIQHISRMAVSPLHDRIALVADGQ